MNLKTNSRFYDPATNPEVGLSNCCNAPSRTIPPSFGDPSMALCSNCFQSCFRIWKPMFEMVQKGVYRRIEYAVIPKEVSNTPTFITGKSQIEEKGSLEIA